MITISDYELAHKVVDRHKNLFWDGWTIVEFKQNPEGSTYKNGMFRNGKWGVAKRFEPTPEGWKVPDRYARV